MIKIGINRAKSKIRAWLDTSTFGLFIFKKIYSIRLKILVLSSRRKLQSEVDAITEYNKKLQGQTVLLPLIETAHYKSIQLLLIAKALELRGSKVTVLICGQHLSACEIRSIKTAKSDDPCWRCKINEEKLLPLFGLRVARLKDFVQDGDVATCNSQIIDKICSEIQPHFNRCIEDSVTRYYYGNVPSDADAVELVRDNYRKTAYTTLNVAHRINHAINPQLILGYMCVYAEWEPYWLYFNRQNIPFRLVSSTPFNGRAQQFHWPDLYNSKQRFELYCSKRESQILTPAEDSDLTEYLRARAKGVDPVIRKLGISKEEAKDELSEYNLTVDKQKRNIFLFPNVYWDVGMTGLESLYTSIIQWVIETIKLAENDKSLNLFIRCHPAEVLNIDDGAKGIEDFIRDEWATLPANVQIISSKNRISSYALFPYIDLGVVMNGTIGLEMLLNGVDVVTVGQAPYSFINGLLRPKDFEEYYHILKGKKIGPKCNHDEIRLFAYFYFIKTALPWQLTKSAYPASIFDGFEFDSLVNLLPGKNRYLDHLCDCILGAEESPESW